MSSSTMDKRKLGFGPIPQAFSESSMDLEGYLQQPVEDATIVRELVQLRVYIESHTSKFYHLEPAPDKLTVDILKLRFQKEAFEDGLTKAAAIAAARLIEPESRPAGIKIAIARTILANIAFLGDPDRTLLSSEALALMSTFRIEERPEDCREVDQIALSRFRILVTHLLSVPGAKSPRDVSDEKVDKLFKTLVRFLGPFIDNRYSQGSGREEWARNLDSIIRRAAKIGSILFAQPSRWEFRWEDLSGSSLKDATSGTCSDFNDNQTYVVVFPALWKTGDLNGKTLSKPDMQLEAESEVTVAPHLCTADEIKPKPAKLKKSPGKKEGGIYPDSVKTQRSAGQMNIFRGVEEKRKAERQDSGVELRKPTPSVVQSGHRRHNPLRHTMRSAQARPNHVGRTNDARVDQMQSTVGSLTKPSPTSVLNETSRTSEADAQFASPEIHTALGESWYNGESID